MFSKEISVVILLLVSILLSACNDFKSDDVVKPQFESRQFSVSCELVPSEFFKIMEENISNQIRCLHENLNLFIRVVKSEKPNHLSRAQLEAYLARAVPPVEPEIVKSLGAVFEIGHLITGEDPQYISKATIDKLISFALSFNEKAAINFGPIFKNKTPASYALHQIHRERVSKATREMVQELRTIYNPNRGNEIHKLNLLTLMDSFVNDENQSDIENAKKVLFIKKIILGGENHLLTHTELEKFLFNFDHLILFSLDIVRYKYILLKQESILQFLKRDIDDLFEIVTSGDLNNRDSETLFTIEQAVDAVKAYVPKEDFDIDKFKTLIGEVKKIVMQGDTVEVKGGELKTLFNHATDLLKRGIIFHKIYDKYKVQLNSRQEITIDFSDYLIAYPDHSSELKQFERIVNPKSYRFMKGEFLSAYYTKDYHRNPDAVFEISLFEFGLTQLFKNFGSASPGTGSVGGYSINKDQMQKLVKKFENELIDLDLITPQKALGTADNISLLGSLFQYQSDKNGVMDVNEAAEFASSLFSSINISEDIHDYFDEKLCEKDQFGRVEPVCYRKNFFKGLCVNYRSYYPLFFESLNAPEKCEDFENTPANADFLNRAIFAARTCNNYTDGNKEEIYYSKSDTMTILLAFIHAETTVLRWDLNKNNIMDSTEVAKAYDIYSSALDGLLEGKSPILKKFKKQIFQYIIKYEKVPDEKDFGSVLKFIKFLVSFDKKAPATRRTILSVLMTISEENAKLQPGPPFDCNLMKDPLNIPREAQSGPNSTPVEVKEDYSSLLLPYVHLQLGQ